MKNVIIAAVLKTVLSFVLMDWWCFL